jgi:hypothetical protein
MLADGVSQSVLVQLKEASVWVGLESGDGGKMVLEEMEQAAEHLQAAAVLRPVSLDLKDGLGRTPRERAAELLPALLPTLDEEHQAAFRRAFPESYPWTPERQRLGLG